MAGGRPRKPDHLKVVAGTDQPSRMNPLAPRPTKSLPSPPENLTERAAEWFLRVLAILDGMGIASADHVDALAMAAQLADEIQDYTAVLEDVGTVYFVPIFGMFDKDDRQVFAPKPMPQVAMRQAARAMLKNILTEFGLTPAAVSKVSVSKDADENDPTAEFG